jgi:hypothetical protein
MNNSYNYADFSGVSLSSNNELEHQRSQPELQQVSTHSAESSSEKRIENMLLSHSKFYVYCE